MLFTSLSFILLFLLTFGLYYLPFFSKVQVQILILSSMFFYAFEEPVLLLLLLTSAFINIFCSYYIIYGLAKHKTLLATIGVVVNLAILAFFKYGGFLVHSLNFESSELGKIIVSLPLPIGISFFTFEGISLVVDCSKEDFFKKEKVSLSLHAQRTLLFISFFPHLIAGPILKAHQFFTTNS